MTSDLSDRLRDLAGVIPVPTGAPDEVLTRVRRRRRTRAAGALTAVALSGALAVTVTAWGSGGDTSLQVADGPTGPIAFTLSGRTETPAPNDVSLPDVEVLRPDQLRVTWTGTGCPHVPTAVTYVPQAHGRRGPYLIRLAAERATSCPTVRTRTTVLVDLAEALPADAPIALGDHTALPFDPNNRTVSPDESTACPLPSTTRIVDYVPFVTLNGRSYLDQGTALPTTAKGEVVGTVRCRLDGTDGRSATRPADGDAAFLPLGTQLHAEPGFDTAFRVLVTDPADGLLHHYDVTQPAIGQAPFPGLYPRVTALLVVDGSDGSTVLGEVTTGRRAVLDALLTTPVRTDPASTGDLLLSLQLDDGTTATVGYDRATGKTAFGQQLSAQAQATVQAATR